MRRISVKSLVVASCSFLLAHQAQAIDSKVRVEGGAGATGHVYDWTVINDGTSPIVQLKMHHHRATLFLGPDGWKIDCQNLMNVGVSTPWGECQATAPAGGGIAPGRRATFRMQCSPTGTTRGRGTIFVRFADEAEGAIDGVELPKPESTGDRYIPLFGLAAIAAIYAIIHAARRRRAALA